MKILHSICLVFHALIAGTHAHECFLAQPDPHRDVVAFAYVALTIAQFIFVYKLLRADRDHPIGPLG